MNHAHSRSLIRLLRKAGHGKTSHLQLCEVGVLAGINAASLAGHFPAATLWLIDPYSRVKNPRVNGEIGTWGQEQFSGTMLQAIGRLRPFGDRVRWLITHDHLVVSQFPDGFLDLVFLDHLHDAATMERSLPLWLPKIKPGGFLTGHDYGSKMDREGVYGVQSSVDAFFAERKMPVEVWGGHVWVARA